MRLVVFVLSFFGPGAGHVLIGRPRRGAAFLALCIASSVAALLLSPLGFVVCWAIAFAAAVDAARLVTPATKPVWSQWLLFVAGLAAVSFGVRIFVLEAFKIASSSMSPTLLAQDHIFIGKLDRDVHRGDVIVFAFPVNTDKDFVSRAVAVGGDHVKVRGDALYVNGTLATAGERTPCGFDDWDDIGQAFTRTAASCATETLDGRSHTVAFMPRSLGRGDFPEDAEEYVVPPGHVFTLGDNRNNSHDGRYWGPVPLANVKGKVWQVWWSSGPDKPRWDRIGARVR